MSKLSLLPVLEQLLIGLQELSQKLRTIDQLVDVPQDISKARYFSGFYGRNVLRHPQLLAVWPQLPADRFDVLQPSVQEHVNHPANRYIAWMLLRSLRKLQHTIPQLSSHSQQIVDQIRQVLNNAPWDNVVPASPSEQAFLVILNDPMYSQVHRIGSQLHDILQSVAVDGAVD